MRKTFTPEEANKALIFVKAILSDIQSSLTDLKGLKNAKEDPSETEIQKILERISHFVKELTQFGCLLEDIEKGIVDFPSYFNGDLVVLCFRLGEEKVEYWHPIDGSYENRHAIEEQYYLLNI